MGSFCPLGGGGGGGLLGLEKGTDCGPTAELWLSQANIAKKEGCPVIMTAHREQSNLFI